MEKTTAAGYGDRVGGNWQEQADRVERRRFWAVVADEARALGSAIHGGGVSLFEAKGRDREIVSERAPERKNKQGRDRGRRM